MASDPADKKHSSRWQKGQSGNPAGRPPGLRNRATIAAEVLLEGEAESITRKAVEHANAGDPWAVRLCMERILPARKDRPVKFQLPPIATAADAATASSALVIAVSEGDLTPSEAAELGKLVESFVRTLEAHNFEQRLIKLEQRNGTAAI